MGLINKIFGIGKVKIIAKTPEGRKVTYENMPEGVNTTEYLARRLKEIIPSIPEANKISVKYQGTTIESKSW